MRNEEKKRVGRKPTGNAKTSTERGRTADDNLLKAGGSILSKVRLSPDATKALAALTDKNGSKREAIESAIIEAAKRLKSTSFTPNDNDC